MRSLANRRFSTPMWQRGVAASLLLLHLFASAIAGAERLHHWVHADAEAEHHQCLAALLQGGQVEPAADSLEVRSAPDGRLVGPWLQTDVGPGLPPFLLPPSRAPPA